VNLNSELQIYRGVLPHWRLEGSVYFVTWSLAVNQPVLSPVERDIVKSTLFHFEGVRYIIYAYVVMDDHVHLLVQPLIDWQLEKLVQSWKRFSAARIKENSGREIPIWEHEYMDRIIRDEKEFLQKANYILTNPVRRWPEVVDYPWVGLGSEGEP